MSAAALNYMTRWRKSIYKCPACDRLLWMLPLTEGVVYFCSYNSCPSIVDMGRIKELPSDAAVPEYYESEETN